MKVKELLTLTSNIIIAKDVDTHKTLFDTRRSDRYMMSGFLNYNVKFIKSGVVGYGYNDPKKEHPVLLILIAKGEEDE